MSRRGVAIATSVRPGTIYVEPVPSKHESGSVQAASILTGDYLKAARMDITYIECMVPT